MIKIPFPKQKYDYIVVPGLIYRDRKQVMVDFLVDTGASTTMVDPRIMANIGYSHDCNEYVGPTSVSGPAGKEFGYRVKVQKMLIHLAELSITDTEIVCIRPEKDVEALLGLNFLRHFHYCVDHTRHVLSIHRL